MDPNAILQAILETEKIGEMVATKVEASKALNVFTDRSQAFADLFDPEKHDDAYRHLYTDMQAVCVKKGITPSAYWYDEVKKEGAPCISIPLATLKELMDAGTR